MSIGTRVDENVFLHLACDQRITAISASRSRLLITNQRASGHVEIYTPQNYAYDTHRRRI